MCSTQPHSLSHSTGLHTLVSAGICHAAEELEAPLPVLSIAAVCCCPAAAVRVCCSCMLCCCRALGPKGGRLANSVYGALAAPVTVKMEAKSVNTNHIAHGASRRRPNLPISYKQNGIVK